MTHLSRETLIAWRDRPTDETRALVVPHLAVCHACTAVYAELVRTQPPTESPQILDPAAFTARGHAARRTGGRLFGLPRWVFVPAAAAAGLLAMVVMRPATDDAPVFRGGAGLQATAPSGEVVAAGEFTWDAPDSATMFRIEILDPAGAVVHEARARGHRYSLPSEVAASLRHGIEYRWSVSQIDARGETLDTSPASTFTIK